MTIRNRLRTAILATIGLIVTLGVLILNSQTHMHHLVEKTRQVDELGNLIFQINALTSDYLLSPSERSKQQVISSHQRMIQRLDAQEIDLSTPLSLGHQSKDSLQLFERLDALQSQPQGPERETLKTVLVGQMLTRSNGMITRIQATEMALHQQMAEMQVFYQWANFVLLVCSALAAIGLFRQLTGKISIPLEQLKQVAERIGQGDFSVRATLPGQDEFGLLATAMNTMAINLQETTARKDQLDAEVDQRRQSEQQLNVQQQQQQQLIKRLEQVNNQLIQSEKMAAIGQLAAGVAHEINNPAGFVNSNLNSMGKYVDDLKILFNAYQEALETLPDDKRQPIKALTQKLDIDYIWQDFGEVINESSEGMLRVCKIVDDLKYFSHQGDEQMALHDVNEGLERTLNVVRNELKYKCQVQCDLQSTRMIECNLQQLNQVFMNLLINAAQAIVDEGQVMIRTSDQEQGILIEVEDSGCGIEAKHLSRLFEPFFTTKPVGKGTGLGLSISYGIIQHHHGELTVTSKPGVGSCFSIRLPLIQPPATDPLTRSAT